MLHMPETIVIHFLLYLCKKDGILSKCIQKRNLRKKRNKSTFFLLNLFHLLIVARAIEI